MSSSHFDIITVPTTPFAGQKPGTSGLRKKVVEFEKENYLENFVQSIINALPQDQIQGSKLVVSGDGRYYNVEAIHKILRIIAANGFGGAVIGLNGLLSTPACSLVIRKHKLYGGIILTASHNPGGPTEDFGIKYNSQNGGPAQESLTDSIYKITTEIKSFKTLKQNFTIDLSKVGVESFDISNGRKFEVKIIDGGEEYSQAMSQIFDFPALKQFIHNPKFNFSFIYDAMNGVAGPFAESIFIKALGANPKFLINSTPKPDFGGGHPDPNLTYAHDLVEKMGLDAAGRVLPNPSNKSIADFGAAADGDADRNMILGKEFFVTPSDSLAIIVANAQSIPYFRDHGVKGVARSMPTSAAVDRVAKALGIHTYEVPTGWKFFGNLMDAGKLSICGEESFGTGSDHIREKDGIWAVLAWLSILQSQNAHNTSDKLISVKDIVINHWNKYGRNYYCRFDYENVDSNHANQVMKTLIDLQQEIIDKKHNGKFGDFAIDHVDEFTYSDPVDGSISRNQGIRFLFKDGSRIVYRLSGTGSVGATIRVYIEKYQDSKEPHLLNLETQTALAPLAKIALEISKMQQLTGRDKPTVIT